MRFLEGILAASPSTELERLVSMMKSHKTEQSGLHQAEGHFSEASPETFWHSSLVICSDTSERSVGLPGAPMGHSTMPIVLPVRAFFQKSLRELLRARHPDSATVPPQAMLVVSDLPIDSAQQSPQHLMMAPTVQDET